MKKGTVIVMSMIVKKVALQQECASRQRNACPRCYETRVGVIVLDDGWQEWYVILFCYPPTDVTKRNLPFSLSVSFYILVGIANGTSVGQRQQYMWMLHLLKI